MPQPTTLREMAGQPGTQGGQQQTPPPGTQRERTPPPGEEDEDPPDGIDVRRLWNENRKLSRLHGKSQKELNDLRSEFEPLKGVAKKFDSFRSLFAEEGGEQQDPTKEQPSIYDRARRQHERIREADPDAPGMPLTVDIAQTAWEASQLVKEQTKTIEQLQNKLKQYEQPMMFAEQQAFVSIDGKLWDACVELFGDENVAAQNYKDFERVAIDQIKAIKGDPKQARKWQKIVTSGALQDDFVQGIVSSKIPRGYTRGGAREIEEYSVEDARRDQAEVERMVVKTNADAYRRAELAKKARQRLLQETFASQVDMGGRR